MTVTFKTGLKPGQGLRFGVDRDLAVSGLRRPNEGNGADELGGADRSSRRARAARDGMAFVAARADGTRIRRRVHATGSARAGRPIDGYGVVNAERAVLGR